MADFRKSSLLVALLLTLVTAGCGTSASVRKLTTEAGDASASLGQGLSNFSKVTNEITESRVLAIASVKGATAQTQVALDQELDLKKKYSSAQEKKKVALLDEAEKLVIDVAKKSGSTKGIVNEERKTILGGQTALTTPTKDYKDLGAALLKFAEDDDILERLQFTVGFIKQVVDDVRKAQSDAAKSEDKAKSSTQKVKSAAVEAVPKSAQ